ncbi:UTP--glucose-1-phosphate uridylyltransferase AglF [uncultured archaeon]|nr:UTP--glucose-1-phosphate uridylyltransferase AglF [uncultured archaeon]
MKETENGKKYQALILVGGLGTRLRPVTKLVPKPMVEIDGRPFLEFKIESLKKYGITDFIFSVGHLGHVVEEYFGDGKRFGVSITYSYERNELLGTAGSIKNAEPLINGTFLAMNGDTFVDIDIDELLKFHNSHDSPFTMVVAEATHAKTQELVELNNLDITGFHKRETEQHANHLKSTHRPFVNGGIYVLEKEILDYIPGSIKVSLEQEVFPKILGKMKGFLHRGYMLDIADERDWGEFKKDIKDGLILPSICRRQKIVRSRAPIRITFGGGGTDIFPYDENHGGMCISATINRYVYSTLKLRDDKKINIKSDIITFHGGFETYSQSFENLNEIKLQSDPLDIIKAVILEMQPGFGFDLYIRSEVPPHSGLGASASLCVSVIGVLNQLRKKDRLTRHEIAETAFKIEENRMNNKGGRQDQYAAAFGGINLLEFKGGNNVRINPVDAHRDYILELEKNLLIVFSGRRGKSSGEVHKEESDRGLFQDSEKINNLHDIKDTAIQMEFNLRRGNLKRFGELMLEGWEKKKKFNSSITNIYIDALVEEAIANGAVWIKLMGAGGGGHLLIYCKPDHEHKISEVLAQRGGKSLDFSFDFEGLKVWEVEEE